VSEARAQKVDETVADLATGGFQLVAGVCRAGDRVRLETKTGLFVKSDHWTVKRLEIR